MNDTIDEENFREAARDAVKKYFDIDMIVDALFWQKIVGLYEEKIKSLENQVEMWQSKG
jgi:hypothetical protein